MKTTGRFKAFAISLGLLVATGASADTNLTDIWWNPTESGWGVTLTQEWNGPIFAAIYSYDASGKPTWLVGSMNPLPGPSIDTVGRTYEGDLFETSGGAPLTAQTFNPRPVTTPVGTMRFAPSAEYKGTLTYTYKGTTVSKQIERYTVSALSNPGATAPGLAYRATAQSISNGQCSNGFPINTRTNFAFRMQVSADKSTWNIGQCDAGSTTSCPISTPICTFTTTAAKFKQYGNLFITEGNLNCGVGGSANPLTGGKTGEFSAEFYDMRLDDAGFSGKLDITDGSGCRVVSSVMIKSGGWTNGCTFVDAQTLSCTN